MLRSGFKTNSMKYTCAEYRIEMILVSLRHRLRQKDLDEAERKDILSQIENLETAMKLN
jgi:hypothetical protein